jgi:hypothetical protein
MNELMFNLKSEKAKWFQKHNKAKMENIIVEF